MNKLFVIDFVEISDVEDKPEPILKIAPFTTKREAEYFKNSLMTIMDPKFTAEIHSFSPTF